MRWQNLFDDLESQLETELGSDEVDLLAEEERLRLGRLALRDRLRALRAASPSAPLALRLRDGRRMPLRIAAIGRDWIAGDRDAGARRSVVVPLAAIAGIDLPVATVPRSLDADPVPEPAADLSTRLGMAFVLRDLCRRRARVEVAIAGDAATGTIDRVGRDHLDLAEHAIDEPRRAGAVDRIRIVPFGAIDAVAF